MSISFKAWSLSTLQNVISWSIKLGYKSRFFVHLLISTFIHQNIHYHHLNHLTCYITGICISIFTLFNICTKWKVSKCRVYSGPYFPAFGLNTEICGVNLRIQSNCRKIRTRKYSVFGHCSCSYTWWLQLLRCWNTESICNTAVALQYLSYGTSCPTMKICLNAFILPCMHLPFPHFLDSVVNFSNRCDSTSFQMFLYWSIYSGTSEVFKWYSIRRILVVLWHAITKYVFWSLDEQRYHFFLKCLIAYNIPLVFPIIVWHFIRNHNLVYIDYKYVNYLPLLVKVFRCNLYLTKSKSKTIHLH